MNLSTLRSALLFLLDEKKHLAVIEGERPSFAPSDAIEEELKVHLLSFEEYISDLSNEDLVAISKELFLRSIVLLNVGSGIDLDKAKKINDTTTVIIDRIKNSLIKGTYLRIVQ